MAPWPGIDNTLRGRWWLPPSLGYGESYESVLACGSSMHQRCCNYALTNLLFGLCKFVWIIDLLVTLPSPYPRAPPCPSTLEVLRTRECTPTLHSSVMFTLDSHLSPLKSLRVCHNWSASAFTMLMCASKSSPSCILMVKNLFRRNNSFSIILASWTPQSVS
jgi:hypothetical protein